VNLPGAFCFQHGIELNEKEKCHEKHQAARPIPVSRSRVNGARDIRPKRACNAVTAWSTAARSCRRSSAETILARAAPAAGFKNCCMLTGEYDGSERDDFYRD
jgi:hypothetical protein